MSQSCLDRVFIRVENNAGSVNLYYIAFALYSFFHAFEMTNYDAVFGLEVDLISKVATVICVALLLFKLTKQNYTKRSIKIVCTALTIGAASFLVTGSWIVLSVALFVTAAQDVDVEKVMRVLLATSTLVLLLAVLGYCFGIIETVKMSRPGETFIRNSLGFFQVNAPALLIARISTACVLLWWKDRPITTSLFLLLSLVILEMLVNSRTTEIYLAILFFCVLSAHLTRRFQMSARTCVLVLGSVLAISVLSSLILMILFDPSNHLLMKISQVLSHRLFSAWYAFCEIPLTLFGRGDIALPAVIWTGVDYATGTVDNGWVLWLLYRGIVPTAMLIVGLIEVYVMHWKLHQADMSLVLLTLSCAFFAFCESSALSFDGNPLFLLMASAIYFDGKNRKVRSSNDSKSNSLHLVRPRPFVADGSTMHR